MIRPALFVLLSHCRFPAWTCLVAGLVWAGLLGAPGARAATALTWNAQANAVDADISSSELVPVLERIAAATGWKIYLEPGTKRTISVKFKGRTTDRAMDLLLGDLGRVLLPGTNGGPHRLLVFRSAQKEATQLIEARERKARDTSKPIPNELIVTVKPGTDLEALAKKLGAKIVGKSKGLNSARLQFEDADAADAARKALEGNEDVVSTDPNFAVNEQPVPRDVAGANRAGPSIRPVQAGDPVVVALIDSQVGSLGAQYDAFLVDRVTAATTPANPGALETLNHGTAMFSTALNAMQGRNDGSNVRFLGVDVFGGNEMTTTYELAEGLYKATQGKATVFSMPLGTDGDSPYLRRYIEDLVKSGYVIVAAAGNKPVATPTYPAAYAGVVAVTAGDGPGKIAAYANFGQFVDVMAPGQSQVNYRGFVWTVNGTSPATAFAAGKIADLMDAHGLKAADAVATLQKALPPPPIVTNGK